MSLESWDVVWLLIDMLMLWIKYALLYKLICIPWVYGENQYTWCKYMWFMFGILSVYNWYIISIQWV